MKRPTVQTLLATLIVGLVAAGCSSATASETSAASSIESAQSGKVQSTFADSDPCRHDDGISYNTVPMSGHLVAQTKWYRLKNLTAVAEAGRQFATVDLLPVESDGVGDRALAREVGLRSDLIEPLGSALKAEVPVFVTTRKTGDDFYLDTIVVTPSDEPAFFAGLCTHMALFEPFQALNGENTDKLLRELPFMTSQQRAEAVGIRPQEPVPEVVILNPEDVSEEVLLALQYVSVSVQLDEGLLGNEGKTVCFKSTPGWNDCVILDKATSEFGVDIDAYVDRDGVVEAWLMDERAMLTDPLELLGSFTLEERLQTGATALVSLRLGSPKAPVEILAQGTAEDVTEDEEVWGLHTRLLER